MQRDGKRADGGRDPYPSYACGEKQKPEYKGSQGEVLEQRIREYCCICQEEQAAGQGSGRDRSECRNERR